MPPSTAASSRARKAPIRFEGEENSLKPKQVKKTSRSKPKTTSVFSPLKTNSLRNQASCQSRIVLHTPEENEFNLKEIYLRYN